MDWPYLLTMLCGYGWTVSMETPILVAGLSCRHTLAKRVFAGFWLTACSYPLLWLVLPTLIPQENRTAYLAVGETMVPIVECLLFWLAFGRPAGSPRRDVIRDSIVVVVANVASFVLGLYIHFPGMGGE